MEAMQTRRLVLAFATWQMRRIPAKPRMVTLSSGGVTPRRFQTARPKLLHLLRKVEAGEDLTPHLSLLVGKKGIILPGANPADRGKDIDMVLTRHGLHHFHVDPPTPSNPKGRSGSLLFAEVLDKEFRIVAITDQHPFKVGSPEQIRFLAVCDAYTAKEISAGQAFMANPVMASGHALLVSLFADRCEAEIDRLDPLLDDPFLCRSALPTSAGLEGWRTCGQTKKPLSGMAL